MSKYYLSLSGGKDSTALFLLLIERGLPLDVVRYFDEGLWGFPEMDAHINKLESITGVRITRVGSGSGLSEKFYNAVLPWDDSRKGKGFPTWKQRWCNTIKIAALDQGMVKGDVVYIGIGFNERNRIKRRPHRTRQKFCYPLIEWRMTEEDALAVCGSYGVDFGGLYYLYTRTSCFCCPLANMRNLKRMFYFHPFLWRRLLKMQSNTWSVFKRRGDDVISINAYDLDFRFREFWKKSGFKLNPVHYEPYPDGEYLDYWVSIAKKKIVAKGEKWNPLLCSYTCPSHVYSVSAPPLLL